ncbi:MAG: hypothetical protein ACOX0R_02280 [Candidatus Dojkabacteria bacterium]
MGIENIFKGETYRPSYSEVFCKSFEDAVEEIASETDEDEKGNEIFLCDIDGVLFPNVFDKLPVYALWNNSEIPDDIQSHLWFLREEFGDRLMILTNRNPELNLFLSSEYIVDRTREVTDPEGTELKIFDSLYKQFPFLGRENKREVVEHIGKMCEEMGDLTIYAIEDWSTVSLNRKTYLLELANNLYKRFGIRSNILNYVIKR